MRNMSIEFSVILICDNKNKPIISLYIKVPQAQTIEIIKNLLHSNSNWKLKTKLSEDYIIHLLELCLKCTYFRFRDKMYYQNEGVPMGSPISPIFVYLFMQNLVASFLPVSYTHLTLPT